MKIQKDCLSLQSRRENLALLYKNMKTTKIAFKHLEACRQAVITFAKAKNIQIQFSGPFRLDRKDFFSALPFSGYAVAYVAFSDNGKGLYAGYSHDCYGIQNYITSAPDGHGTVKQDWPQGNPDYIEFYCLSNSPAAAYEQPVHGWMIELRAILNGIIYAIQPEPAWPSVKYLLQCVNDLYGLYPYLADTPAGAVLLSWQKALTSGKVDEVDIDKLLRVITDDEYPIIIRTGIQSKKDPAVCIQLQECKDLELIAKLPIYADKKVTPSQLVIHILTEVSNTKFSKDEV